MICCSRARVIGAFMVVLSLPAAAAFTIIGESSNPALVPNQNIAITGSNTNRVVTITPLTGRSGTASVTFAASDGVMTVPLQFSSGPGNLPPFVSAGADQLAPLNRGAVLSGFVSDDGLPNPPGRVLMWWSIIQAAGPIGLGSSNSLTIPLQFPIEGTYRFRLTATDGFYVTSDDVTILVTPPENTGPTISGVSIASVTASNAVIAWNTSRPASSEVQYGTTSSYGLTSGLDASLVTAHVVELTNLVANTFYYFRVLSRDAAGELTVSDDFVLHTPAPRGERMFYLPIPVQQAQLQTPMALHDDPIDAAQQYIMSPMPEQGSARLHFYVPENATYILWCRARAVNSSQNSFYVTVDGMPEQVYNVAEGKWSANWQWDALTVPSAGTNAVARLTLPAGSHTILFRAGETNTALSRLLLTNDPEFVPRDGELVQGTEDAATLTNTVLRLGLNPGYSLIANQLHRGGNTVAEVLPNVPQGTRLFKFNPVQDQYAENMFGPTGWQDPEQVLAPGEGAFILHPGLSTTNLVFVGEMRLDVPVRVFTKGMYLLSLMYPRGGVLHEIIDTPIRTGDAVFRFNPFTGGYDYYELGWGESPVEINAGESFFLYRQ